MPRSADLLSWRFWLPVGALGEGTLHGFAVFIVDHQQRVFTAATW